MTYSEREREFTFAKNGSTVDEVIAKIRDHVYVTQCRTNI